MLVRSGFWRQGQVRAIRQQGWVTHEGRVSYQGDSSGLTEVGNPSATKGMRKAQKSATQPAHEYARETQRASEPLLR